MDAPLASEEEELAAARFAFLNWRAAASEPRTWHAWRPHYEGNTGILLWAFLTS